MKYRWRDYDDGFDEATLHEDEEFAFRESWKRKAARRQQRLRVVESAKDQYRRDSIAEESRSQWRGR